MRTSRISRLFALLLALLLVCPAAALADPCALCGSETHSESYLCAACLLDLLEGEARTGGLELGDPIVCEDGSVVVSWSDSADNGPYQVYYELLESAPVPFGWTAARGVQGNSCVLTQLVPGVSYIFTVSDKDGNKVHQVYYAQQPGDGNEIGARIRFKTMRRHDRTTKNVQWSAEEIAQDNGYTHGLYLRLTYSTLKKTRNYAFCVSVEAPNGFSDVIFSGGLTLDYGKSQVPVWGFIPMDDYFACLESYYGGIPTGEYIVTLYFNGGYVDSSTFEVAE